MMNLAPMRHRHRSQYGFTLMESLIVLVIAAVLLALLFSKAKSGLESAKSAKCVQNLKQLGAQTMVYVADSGSFPRMIHQVDGIAVPGTFYENIMNSPVKTCAICPSAKFTGYSKNNRPQEGYGGNPLVLALHIENTNQPGRPTLPPVRPVQIARPSQVILLTDGAQFTANGFALGMSTIWYGKFNGLPGNPSKAETPLTASEVLPGGYWDPDVSQIPLRHNGRANIIFCDGHVTSISAISQLKEKNIYWNY
jgi:prepilin-type processing-associated H-X9-DG protein/prepilin-type N-terminal cleavage/methylation domain-containing protein